MRMIKRFGIIGCVAFTAKRTGVGRVTLLGAGRFFCYCVISKNMLSNSSLCSAKIADAIAIIIINMSMRIIYCNKIKAFFVCISLSRRTRKSAYRGVICCRIIGKSAVTAVNRQRTEICATCKSGCTYAFDAVRYNHFFKTGATVEGIVTYCCHACAYCDIFKACIVFKLRTIYV